MNYANLIVYILLGIAVIGGVVMLFFNKSGKGFFNFFGIKKGGSNASSKNGGALFFNAEQKDLFERYFSAPTLKTGCLSKQKPITDGEYCGRVNSRKRSYNLYARAIAYLGVDEDSVKEIPPVEFEGYLRQSENPLNKPVFYGASGLYTNIYESTWFFFGDSEIYIYRFVFDMLSGSTFDESREICYKDVTSFAVKDLAEEVDIAIAQKGGCFRKSGVIAAKAIKRYMRFRVVVPGENADNLDYVMTADNNLSSKIHAMKQKLREKKL